MKSKILQLLCTCVCIIANFSAYPSKTTDVYSKNTSSILKAHNDVGKRTVDFIKRLEKQIPKIIDEIKSNKTIKGKIITAFLKQYGDDFKLSEFLNFQSSFDKTIGIKFGKLLIHILIESVLITCEDNLKKHNVDNYYLDKVQRSMKNIKQMLRTTENINSTELTKEEHKKVNNLLKKLEYKKLIAVLNITLKEIQTRFEESIKKAIKYFLDTNGINMLENILEKELFNKIKNSTKQNSTKLSALFNNVTLSIEAAKNLIIEWSNYLKIK